LCSDGMRLFSGGLDQTIRVRASRTFALPTRQRSTPNQSMIGTLTIVIACWLSFWWWCVCQMWDLETGSLLKELRGHQACVSGLVMCGTRLVSSSYDKSVIVWDVASGEPQQRWIGHTGPVNCVATIRDDRVVTAGDDKTARVGGWEGVKPGVCAKLLLISRDCVCIWSQIWDMKSGTCIAKLVGHSDYILAVAVLDSVILTAGMDNKIKVGYCPALLSRVQHSHATHACNAWNPDVGERSRLPTATRMKRRVTGGASPARYC